MIETPAAAAPGRDRAEADFLSIGTNDLVQHARPRSRAAARLGGDGGRADVLS